MDERYPASQPPSRCPFSGVAIDPKMWASFQAKMRAQKQEEGEDDQESFGALLKFHHPGMDQTMLKDHMPPVPIIHTADRGLTVEEPVTTLLRVNVSNDLTKRSKDLLLDIAKEESLWDAIYNNPAIKTANVRKWNSEIAADVKAGTKEIQLVVASRTTNTMRNEKIVQEELGSHSFPLQTLKETTTRQLYEQLMTTDSAMSDVVLCLSLVCVDSTATTSA